MNRKTSIIVAVSSLAYMLLTKAKRVVSNLAWRVAGFNVLSSDVATNSSLVLLRLQLRNTLPFTVMLDGVTGDVYIQGVRCAVIQQQLQQPIYGNNISTVDLQFNLYWQGIADALKASLLSGNIQTFSVRFAGNLIVEGVSVPVDKVITYSDLFV